MTSQVEQCRSILAFEESATYTNIEQQMISNKFHGTNYF